MHCRTNVHLFYLFILRICFLEAVSIECTHMVDIRQPEPELGIQVRERDEREKEDSCSLSPLPSLLLRRESVAAAVFRTFQIHQIHGRTYERYPSN